MVAERTSYLESGNLCSTHITLATLESLLILSDLNFFKGTVQVGIKEIQGKLVAKLQSSTQKQGISCDVCIVAFLWKQIQVLCPLDLKACLHF